MRATCRSVTVSTQDDPGRVEGRTPIRCAIITVSNSRTIETDESGRAIARVLQSVGHGIVEHTVVPMDPRRMTLVLRHWLTAETDAVILNGGTSLRYQRGTVEVVRELLDRELEGFGEIFRYLRYKQVGPDAMLSRAVCGIARGKVVFSMPGSRAATQLAMERLVLPELPRLVQAARDAAGTDS